MGRRTYEVVRAHTPPEGAPEQTRFVFSRTLAAEECPGVTVIAGDAADSVAALRRESGRDIWLMGGGVLFAALLEAGLVDVVEVAVVPVLLGGGIPLLPAPFPRRTRLVLRESRRYATSGIVWSRYEVAGAGG